MKCFVTFIKNNIYYSSMPVMAIPGCRLDYIWNKIKSRNGRHTCNPDLGYVYDLILIYLFCDGRRKLLIQILRQEDTRV